jgi:serine/threonine-protein kinase RsbT
MSEEFAGELRVTSESDIVAARRQLRDVTREIGFGITDVTRVVTAGSELTRNMYQYAAGGVVQWQRVEDGGKIGLELVFEDRGPGIPDLDEVMQEGYTSGGGLGMGLPGSKRLMDEMEIDSEIDRGTRIVVRKWLRQG